MTPPGPTRRPIRNLLIVPAAVAVLGLVPAAGALAAPGDPPPAPRTASQAREQYVAFNEQFEAVTEKFNEARILLGERRKESRLADRRAREAQARYAAQSARVRRIVAGAYKTAPFGLFTTMLSSGSPEQFIEQLAVLDIATRRRAAVLAEVGRTRDAAQRTQREAAAALTAARQLASETSRRKADLARRAAVSKALFDRLSGQERAALLSDQTTASERASRATVRPPTTIAATGAAKIAVQTALNQLGDPYVWAAAGPDAFDCSGLTMYAWGAAGVALPHSSQLQYQTGRKVSRSELQPGDLVFGYSPIHHVGIYIGNNQMVHAPNSNDVVKISSIDTVPWAGATRPG